MLSLEGLWMRPTDQFGRGGTACKETNPLSKEREIEAQIFGIPYANSAAEGTVKLTKGCRRGCQEQDSQVFT